jgi:hypothetical protein
MHSLGHHPDKPWLDMEGSWQNRYRTGEAPWPKIHLAASPVGEVPPTVSKRDPGEWAKVYLDFFDPAPQAYQNYQKISDRLPRLSGLTINQCHLRLLVLRIRDKVL